MTAKQLPPPWGRGGVGAANPPHSDKTPKITPFTYTLSAQVYVKSTLLGCTLAPRLPNPIAITRITTELPLPPVGQERLARSERKGWGGVRPHISLINTAATIPPSPCGGGVGGGVRPHTSRLNRKPAVGWISAPHSNKTPKIPPFTYTLSAQVYVNSTLGAVYHSTNEPLFRYASCSSLFGTSIAREAREGLG